MRVLRAVFGAVVLSMITLTATGQSSSNKASFDARVLLVDGRGVFHVMAGGVTSNMDESSVAEWTRGVLRGDARAVIHVAADPAAPRERVMRAIQLVAEAGATAVEVATLTSP